MTVKRIRRTALAVGVAVAATSLLLAGCSSQSSTSAGSGNSNATFVVGISADPTQLLPWTVTSEQSVQVLSQVYAPLLTKDSKGAPTANLSAMPTISADGLTDTFTLRSGIKFSNGSPLTASDVKYTYDTIMDPTSAASSRSYFASVASIDAPTATSLVVHLKYPDASFPAGLTMVNTGIVPSNVPVSTLQTTPLGAGPYAWSSRVPNESITLTRNQHFFGGTPGVKTMQFRVIPDDQSMVSALKTGSVDLAVFDNPVTAKTAVSGKTTMTDVPSLSYHALQLRAASPVLSNVNTRLAIQCAISRQDVIDSAALGAGSVTGPITSPQFRSNPNSQPCPTQNLDKAKEYLKKAGTPNGFTLNLMTSQGLYSTAVAEAENIQSQLGKVGITVNVQTLDSGTYVQKWLSGDFEAAVAENAGSVDPNTMYAKYFTSNGSYNKVAGYNSPELDSLFAQGIATTDVAKRQAIYTKISNQLVDNAPWIWLFTPTEYVVLNSGVHNFQARYDADLSALWEATLS